MSFHNLPMDIRNFGLNFIIKGHQNGHVNMWIKTD